MTRPNEQPTKRIITDGGEDGGAKAETAAETEQPSPPSPENPEKVAAAREKFADEREQERADEREAQSLAERILNARERKTVELELDGESVDFNTMLGETRDEVDDIQMEVADLADKADGAEDDDELVEAIGMTEDEALDKVQEYRSRFVGILVEHAADESLTEEFWLAAYGREGAGRIAMRLKEKSERGDMTEDELRRFRRNRDG